MKIFIADVETFCSTNVSKIYIHTSIDVICIVPVVERCLDFTCLINNIILLIR